MSSTERKLLDVANLLVGGTGIVYAVMAPIWPGQTPLALHATCGITTIRHEGNGLEIAAEAPLLRGLHDGRFPLPPMLLERRNGWLERTTVHGLRSTFRDGVSERTSYADRLAEVARDLGELGLGR